MDHNTEAIALYLALGIDALLLATKVSIKRASSSNRSPQRHTVCSNMTLMQSNAVHNRSQLDSNTSGGAVLPQLLSLLKRPRECSEATGFRFPRSNFLRARASDEYWATLIRIGKCLLNTHFINICCLSTNLHMIQLSRLYTDKCTHGTNEEDRLQNQQPRRGHICVATRWR